MPIPTSVLSAVRAGSSLARELVTTVLGTAFLFALYFSGLLSRLPGTFVTRWNMLGAIPWAQFIVVGIFAYIAGRILHLIGSYAGGLSYFVTDTNTYNKSLRRVLSGLVKARVSADEAEAQRWTVECYRSIDESPSLTSDKDRKMRQQDFLRALLGGAILWFIITPSIPSALLALALLVCARQEHISFVEWLATTHRYILANRTHPTSSIPATTP